VAIKCTVTDSYVTFAAGVVPERIKTHYRVIDSGSIIIERLKSIGRAPAACSEIERLHAGGRIKGIRIASGALMTGACVVVALYIAVKRLFTWLCCRCRVVLSYSAANFNTVFSIPVVGLKRTFSRLAVVKFGSLRPASVSPLEELSRLQSSIETGRIGLPLLSYNAASTAPKTFASKLTLLRTSFFCEWDRWNS
jgi:hypothetical protein